MKLAAIPFALAAAVLWGGAVLLCAVANLIWPGYAADFLRLIDSIYPGYHFNHTGISVVVATGYALVDGLVGGFVLAVLYNLFACKGKQEQPPA